MQWLDCLLPICQYQDTADKAGPSYRKSPEILHLEKLEADKNPNPQPDEARPASMAGGEMGVYKERGMARGAEPHTSNYNHQQAPAKKRLQAHS